MSITNTSSHSAEIMRWNSPLPYLFGGLALILGVISISLLILVCSYLFKKKHSSASFIDIEKQVSINDVVGVNDVPKVVVIMAGDNKPTYIAMPINVVVSAANDSTTPPRPPPPPAAPGVDAQV
ncbi:hypothetical protein BVRB_2g028610 [Beta vulgaris subsp. vulgaris]|nr:hypothetical protein BVRB_2g028610 [Beta vulgaris subsp. vulgaris]